jgi:hypothetical protein
LLASSNGRPQPSSASRPAGVVRSPASSGVLLDLYGVTGPERDGLIQLARDARQPGWWHSFRDVLPNPYEVYIGLEAGTATIRNFEPVVIPGLLQTEEYARKTLRSGPRELDWDEVERRAQVRMQRQRILAKEDRPRLWAVIDEATIRRVVGDPEVMREQLRYLMASAEHEKTTLQVVPFSAGAHSGTTGPFVILDFPGHTDPTVGGSKWTATAETLRGRTGRGLLAEADTPLRRCHLIAS